MTFVPNLPIVLSTSSPLTLEQFRDVFPEFNDSSVYEDEAVIVWMNIAIAQLDPLRWQALWAMGVSLFVAHNLAMQMRNIKAAQRGVPGSTSGIISSKSMGGVSVSFDTGSFAISGGGEWNMTTYGIRFLGWARMIGSGPAQISGGRPPIGSPVWTGPGIVF